MLRQLVRRFSSVSHPSSLCVVGCGQMGQGIGYVGAAVGKNILFVDTSKQQLAKCEDLNKKLLDKDVKKGKLTTEQADKIIKSFDYQTDLAALSSFDFIIEAATENVEAKKKIFAEISKLTSSRAILATNTSSISITKLAAATQHPHNVIGMHFMNPVPIMKLVEVINGLQTSQQTTDTTIALAQEMGKTCSSSKDVPGFIANRLLMPYINEAIYALQDGVSSKEDIDVCMRLGCNMPMGPLQLADFIGLDTCLAIMNVLHSGLGDSKYRPAPLLQSYVDAGWLGKKTKRGFYTYTDEDQLKNKK